MSKFITDKKFIKSVTSLFISIGDEDRDFDSAEYIYSVLDNAVKEGKHDFLARIALVMGQEFEHYGQLFPTHSDDWGYMEPWEEDDLDSIHHWFNDARIAKWWLLSEHYGEVYGQLPLSDLVKLSKEVQTGFVNGLSEEQFSDFYKEVHYEADMLIEVYNRQVLGGKYRELEELCAIRFNKNTTSNEEIDMDNINKLISEMRDGADADLICKTLKESELKAVIKYAGEAIEWYKFEGIYLDIVDQYSQIKKAAEQCLSVVLPEPPAEIIIDSDIVEATEIQRPLEHQYTQLLMSGGKLNYNKIYSKEFIAYVVEQAEKDRNWCEPYSEEWLAFDTLLHIASNWSCFADECFETLFPAGKSLSRLEECTRNIYLDILDSFSVSELETFTFQKYKLVHTQAENIAKMDVPLGQDNSTLYAKCIQQAHETVKNS